MVVLNALAFVYSIGALVGAFVMVARSQAVVRQRVKRRGRPETAGFVYSYLVWAVVKAVFWPVVLTAWLALGRPRPGTWDGNAREAA